MAFSSSSASRWTRSLTTRPATSVAGTEVSSMRSYCSTSEAAARSTSTSGTGRVHRRPGSSPARTSRFSPLRRIRVARWSSLKSEDSWSGSASRDSSSEISESWRWMRPWLRRERLVNIALTLPRSSACSAASRTASRCTSSKARGHLADLVAAVDADRLDRGVDVLRVGLGQLLDQLGQPLLGDVLARCPAAGAASGSWSGRRRRRRPARHRGRAGSAHR